MMDYLQEATNGYAHADDMDFAQTAALISIAQSLARITAAMQPAPVAEKRPGVFRWARGHIRFDTVHRVNVRGDNDITVIVDDSFIQIHDTDAARFLAAYDAWLEPQAEQADFQNRIFDAIKAAGANEVEAIKEASRYHQF